MRKESCPSISSRSAVSKRMFAIALLSMEETRVNQIGRRGLQDSTSTTEPRQQRSSSRRSGPRNASHNPYDRKPNPKETQGPSQLQVDCEKNAEHERSRNDEETFSPEIVAEGMDT